MRRRSSVVTEGGSLGTQSARKKERGRERRQESEKYLKERERESPHASETSLLLVSFLLVLSSYTRSWRESE
jgi:hypothetical protein